MTPTYFVELVRKHFDWVIEACGMHYCTEAQYQNEDVVFAIVYTERRSRRVNVFVKCQRISPVPMELFLILEAYGYEQAAEIGRLTATTPEEADQILARLAVLIRQYALKILQHDENEVLFVSTFIFWKGVRYAWETNKPRSIAAGFPKLISSPYFERVKQTLHTEDLRILEEARRISEDAARQEVDRKNRTT